MYRHLDFEERELEKKDASHHLCEGNLEKISSKLINYACAHFTVALVAVDGDLVKIPCSVMSLGGLLMVNTDIKVIFIIFHLTRGIDCLSANVIASF